MSNTHKFRINRILQGKTQHEIAQEAGITQAYVSQIERGIVPKPEILNRIARVLNMNEEAEDRGK